MSFLGLCVLLVDRGGWSESNVTSARGSCVAWPMPFATCARVGYLVNRLPESSVARGLGLGDSHACVGGLSPGCVVTLASCYLGLLEALWGEEG